MQVFPVEKCQIVWRKDSTSENDRQAILRELRQMSVELKEAVDFTIKMSNKKPNEVKYYLEMETFTISIYYETHLEAWGMLIEQTKADSSPTVVGEIACMDPMTFSFIEQENILKTEPII